MPGLGRAWDSDAQIVRRRGRGARRWAGTYREAHRHDPLVPRRLPGYFVDRYALLEHPLLAHVRTPPVPIPVGAGRRDALSSMTRPARRLGGWTPDPDASTGAGPVYASLRRQWATYCRLHALSGALAELPDARSTTWRQLLDSSVFYPGPPVFRGATYLDALSPHSVDRILGRVGEQGAIDFYCFMLQVHETVHQHQIGEPLLNEVVQAALWIRFLDEHDLWEFQTGKDGPLVREVQLVRRHPEVAAAGGPSGLDSAAVVRSTSCDGVYFAACLLGLHFHTGALRYDAYLSRIGDLFDVRADPGAVRRIAVSALP